jgi:hypothetical protein
MEQKCLLLNRCVQNHVFLFKAYVEVSDRFHDQIVFIPVENPPTSITQQASSVVLNLCETAAR